MTDNRNNRPISLLDSNSEDIRTGKVKIEKPAKRRNTQQEQKKKKRTIYIVAVLAVSILLACVIIPSMLLTINEMLVYELRVEETDITDFADSVYSGYYESSHLSATVSVTVTSGKMTTIVLDDFTGIDVERANDIFARVIYYQMLNIPSEDSADVFSQPTDYIVLKAIEKALTGELDGGLLV